MDLLKTAMDNAAGECSLAAPSVWVSNTDTNYAQLKRYMYDVAREFVRRVDYTELTRDITITGDGGDTYPLQADFERLPRKDSEDDPAVWSDGMQRAFYPVTSNGQWTALQSRGPASSYGYRVVGSNIQFTQTIASGDTNTLAYVSNYWISSGGERVGVWGTEEDLTFIPGKIIELGVTWRWRRKRGLEFASYQGEYEIELSRYANDDRGIRKIRFGQRALPPTPYSNLPVPLLGPDPDV